MSTWQLRLLAVGILAIAAACGITFAALWSEYADYADGDPAMATVTAVEPRGNGQRAELTYDDPDPAVQRRRPGVQHMTVYPRAGEPLLSEGDRVPLRLGARNHTPIRASRLDDKRPSVLLLVGAIVAFALGGWTFLAPRRAAARRAARVDPFEVLVEAVARTRNVAYGLAGFFAAAAAMFVSLAWFDRADASEGTIVGIAVLSAVSLVAAGFVLRGAWPLRDPRHNPITDLLETRTSDLAWFYVRRIQRRGATMLDAMLWKSDGKLAAVIRLVPEDVDALLAEIARRAPHAAQGYSPEMERRYRERPNQWRPVRAGRL